MITKVEYYADSILIGTKTSAPFDKIVWSGASIGSHELTAKVYYDDMTEAVSKSIGIEVSGYNAETVYYMDELNIPDNNQSSIYTGLTNHGLFAVVDAFIGRLKSNSIFGKCYRIYPKIGDTEAQQAVDLTTPSRSGTFIGDWVFSKDGAKSNGTNSLFDTGVISSEVNNGIGNDFGFTICHNEINAALGGSYAAVGFLAGDQRIQMYLVYDREVENNYFYFSNKVIAQAVTTPSIGIYSMSGIDNDVNVFYNGIKKASKTVSNVASFGALLEGGTASANALNALTGVSAYHQGLNETETLNLFNDMDELETNLGRKKYTT